MDYSRFRCGLRCQAGGAVMALGDAPLYIRRQRMLCVAGTWPVGKRALYRAFARDAAVALRIPDQTAEVARCVSQADDRRAVLALAGFAPGGYWLASMPSRPASQPGVRAQRALRAPQNTLNGAPSAQRLPDRAYPWMRQASAQAFARAC